MTRENYIIKEDLLLKHFDFLWPLAYPNKSDEIRLAHRSTVEEGTWDNLGGLLEQAISNTGNIKKDRDVGKDFVDNSDAKLITVRIKNNNKSYTAPISNIHTKTGMLRVACYERIQDKFYFFLIPNSAYSHIHKTSNIEIPFDLEGNPKKENKCEINWWAFEVETFLDICTGTIEEITII